MEKICTILQAGKEKGLLPKQCGGKLIPLQHIIDDTTSMDFITRVWSPGKIQSTLKKLYVCEKCGTVKAFTHDEET